jgi:superfamily II DNA/RNA helicase
VGSTTALITQTVVWAEESDKRRALLEQLAGCSGRTIIFVETKRAAEQLEEFLYRSSVPATSIHGDRSQREREQALLSFRRGSPSVLVATDVAARGLDVPDCMHVINFELPRDINSYVHRIGRTGRMGRQGTAISLFSNANKPMARDMLTLLQEANQAVPEWLLKLATESGPGAGRSGYQGRGKFGGRDFRQNAQVRQYQHNGAAFPGAGGMMGGNGRMGGQGGQGGYMQQGFVRAPRSNAHARRTHAHARARLDATPRLGTTAHCVEPCALLMSADGWYTAQAGQYVRRLDGHGRRRHVARRPGLGAGQLGADGHARRRCVPADDGRRRRRPRRAGRRRLDGHGSAGAVLPATVWATGPRWR